MATATFLIQENPNSIFTSMKCLLTIQEKFPVALL